MKTPIVPSPGEAAIGSVAWKVWWRGYPTSRGGSCSRSESLLLLKLLLLELLLLKLLLLQVLLLLELLLLVLLLRYHGLWKHGSRCLRLRLFKLLACNNSVMVAVNHVEGTLCSRLLHLVGRSLHGNLYHSSWPVEAG